MAKNELSPTMQDALRFAREHGGRLTRYPGGFWCRGDLEPALGAPWFGTTTIEALVARGRMVYTQWKEGRNRFPIEAAVATVSTQREIGLLSTTEESHGQGVSP